MIRTSKAAFTLSVAIAALAIMATCSQAALINAGPFRAQALAVSETVAGGDSTVSTDFPGGENPGLAFDGTTATKFLMFDGEADDGTAGDSGAIVFFDFPVTVEQLRFGFANDAAERDPTNFTLEGSNSVSISVDAPGGTYVFDSVNGSFVPGTVDDDAEWTPIVGTPGLTGMTDPADTFLDAAIASRFAFTDEAPFFRSADAFVNNTAYTAYRILFPETRFPNGFIMQVGEIQLLVPEEQIPEPTSLLLTSLACLGLVCLRRRM